MTKVSKKKLFGKYKKILSVRKTKPTTFLNNVVLGKGFPRKLSFTHKYRDIATATVSGGAMTNYLFSCNGMYDPNISGTGGQPQWFDQLTALYNHYCVIGSKILVRFLPMDQSGLITPTTVACGIFVNDDASLASSQTYLTLGQQSTGKVTYLAPLAVKPTVISRKWSAKKTFGGSVLSNTELQGTNGSNPTDQSYYHLFFQNANLSTTTQSIIFEVELEYIAIWKELKDVGGS